MAQISTSETSNGCMQNGARLVYCKHGAEKSACACDSPSVCTPRNQETSCALIAVFGIRQSLRSEPRGFISRPAAERYVADEVAKFVNRGKGLQFTRDCTYSWRGQSCSPGQRLIEQNALGSQRASSLVHEWKETRHGKASRT